MAEAKQVRTGWGARLAWLSMAALMVEIVTGFAITLVHFHAVVEWGVLLHTVLGAATLLPIAWYLAVHWDDYRRYAMSHVVLLGYVALVGLVVCSISGLVVTWQGLLGTRMSPLWRNVHLVSGIVVLLTMGVHLVAPLARALRGEQARPARRMLGYSGAAIVVGTLVMFGLAAGYPGTVYVNEFPEDYEFLYGEDRPFAPSLARTETGGAFDSRTLAGSETCGTAGCHDQILAEWKPQRIQSIMAEQNGAESTRYCGGCHDPISLFSGTKNIFVENLTGLQGYNEGISCLSCHAIRETDLQGNANYVVSQPPEYLWQWADSGWRRTARDFLIRTYPDEHNRLSKRAFKAPEYCAACHKQFIDEEVNRVGWVQLQNQYDNWAASHWNQEGHPERSVECRECHMPLVVSTDPAAGDASDYNRGTKDGKHRSHRFIASNNVMPALLELEGWEKQVELTEAWLKGELNIPEIEDKWAAGPIVTVELETPESVAPGESIPVRVVMTSNKVGHDFPTGPLDIIQSWVELEVKDDAGRVIFHSGGRDEKNFLEPGTFLFKVEPVDQYGNLIDRHNLWEMVGVRFRRALFPGYSDTVEYVVGCPSDLSALVQKAETLPEGEAPGFDVPSADGVGTYHIVARLHYRKFDQFLLNYMFGEDSGLTAPPVEIGRAEATVRVVAADGEARGVGG